MNFVELTANARGTETSKIFFRLIVKKKNAARWSGVAYSTFDDRGRVRPSP
jgi:hypothetical protein